MGVCRRVDELRSDAELVAIALHRPFKHVTDVQFLADLPDVHRARIRYRVAPRPQKNQLEPSTKSRGRVGSAWRA
jgi:hypothetical protein